MTPKDHKMRRIVRLDGRQMQERGAAHRHLAQRFGFPRWYGKNLDALYDLLTELSRPTKAVLTHRAEFFRSQPGYAARMIKVFEAAQQANPSFRFDTLETGEAAYRLLVTRDWADEPAGTE